MENKKRKTGRPKQVVTFNKKQEIRCLESEKENWKLAADSCGFKSISDWARSVLNKKAASITK